MKKASSDEGAINKYTVPSIPKLSLTDNFICYTVKHSLYNNGEYKMIICINCTTETKAKMDDLLRKDNYSDYSELIAMAVENLWVLDRALGEKGAFVIGEDTSLSRVPLATDRKKPTGTIKPKLIPEHLKKSSVQPSAPVMPSPVCIPDLFLSDGLELLSPPIAETNLFSNKNTDELYTLDRWLFGQYNKLLPVKANCRALIRLMDGEGNRSLMVNVAAKLSEAAALLGDYLAEHDTRNEIGRDDLLSTAFPRSGPEAEKSRNRYANQFIGSVNSQGSLSGLLWEYKLAALDREGSRLLPTEHAIQFARLLNPVLDNCQSDPTQKFSQEEVTFILEHIRSHVPVEVFAFRTLIDAIANGADTPDKLDESLQTLVPTDSERSLSPSFLTSQRSGALSRMADLGLISRLRNGVRVSYTLTNVAEGFMQSK